MFVDTSALYALLDADDDHHGEARAGLDALHARGDRLVTHAYVIVETAALVHARLGRKLVRRLFDAILPIVESRPVTAELHRRAVAAYLAAGSDVSLVDWTSFLLARDEGVEVVFAFDRDFERQGFTPVSLT